MDYLDYLTDWELIDIVWCQLCSINGVPCFCNGKWLDWFRLPPP